MTPSSTGPGNGDRIGDSGRLLLEGVVPRGLLERMQLYCDDVRETLVWDERDGCWNGYTTNWDGLAEACEAVIRAVQDELRRLEPGPVSRDLAHELVVAESWALHALVDRSTKSSAKREHIRIAQGRPLAICRGGGKGRDVQTVLGPMRAVPQGCLRVFEAPTRTSAKMWPQLCPDCRPHNGKRNPPRDAERKQRARAVEILDLRRSLAE